MTAQLRFICCIKAIKIRIILLCIGPSFLPVDFSIEIQTFILPSFLLLFFVCINVRNAQMATH